MHSIELSCLKSEITDYYGNFRISKDLVELRNLAVVAELIIESALKRRESRGLHFTTDYPIAEISDKGENTIIKAKTDENGHIAA